MPEEVGVSQRWAGRPVQAWLVRGVVVVAPLALSFMFVRVASAWLRAPTSSLWLFLGWWFGLSAAATVVLVATDRLSRRLLPLSALLKLSLVFPDETPSRFKTAMSSGSVDTLEKRLKLIEKAKNAQTPRESAAQLLTLIAALSAHDRLTRGHSERVRAYSVLIGKELGLGQHDLDLLNWAALLHDIGKLEVDQSILTKPGKPSDEEWQMLRQHPLFGEKLAAPLAEWLGSWQSAIGYHHERFDGKGYPRGLSGEEIPLPGRIVAVADVYDVITSARSYKEAGNSVDGRQEIARCAGGQFDPRVVRAFLNVSLGRMRLVMGPLSWLSHTPLLSRLPLTPAFGTLGGTLAVAGAAAASGALAQALPAPARPALVAQAAPMQTIAHAAVAGHTSGALPQPASSLPSFLSGGVERGNGGTLTVQPLQTPPIGAPARARHPAASAPAGTLAGSYAIVAASPSPAAASASPPPPTPAVPGPSASPPTSTGTPDSPPPAPSSGISTGPPKLSSPPPTHTPPGKGVPTTTTPVITDPGAPTAPLITTPMGAQLVFTIEPAMNASLAAGTPITFSVSVEDSGGNLLTTNNTTIVRLAFAANPGGATLTCGGSPGPAEETAVAGVASFSCSFDKTGDGYTLAASDTTGTSGHPYTSATSSLFNITAGAAAQLVFTTQPGSTVAGSTVAPAVQVSVEDAHGNLVTGDNTTTVTVAIGTNPGSATLGGTLTQTVSGGVATFNNLTLNTAANGYTLTATSSPAHGTATSSLFNITAGAAAQLVFTTQPGSTVAGSTVAPAVQVSVEDAHGNLVTGDNTTTVTVAIGTNPGSATLGGTLTQTVSGGVATFNNLTLNTAANGYTLTATSSPAHGTATSSLFNITAGAAAQLVFTTQPGSTVAGSTVAPAVQVSVEDAHGNLVTGDNTTTVTVAIGTNPGSATLGGTLTQTVSGGVATFNNLTLNTAANGYTLTATSSPAHGTATSSLFNITAGAAAQLVFTTQPGSTVAGSTVAPAVQVSVEDAHGNLVTGDNTTTVTVAIGTNPGSATLGGTLTQTVSGGVATFNNLTLNTAANGYTLTATSSPAHGTATSSLFNITAGAAAQLVFTTQPGSTVAGSTVAPAVQVSVEDAHGNLVTGDNTTTVTVAIGTNPGSATLGGTLTQTVSGGVATFNNLTLNTAANGYTLTATSSPAHGTATSSLFNITAGAAAQLVFTTQPGSTVAGSTVAPAVQVSVEDAHGNLVTGDNTTTVTVAIGTNPGSATLGGTLTQTVSGGVATFNNLTLNTAANGYTLTATSSPAHGTATSSLFNITVGATVGETLLTTGSGSPCSKRRVLHNSKHQPRCRRYSAHPRPAGRLNKLYRFGYFNQWSAYRRDVCRQR